TPGPPAGIGASPDGSFVGVSASAGASAPGSRPTGLIVGILGSAPFANSNFIAATSVPYAARQNGVAPVVFTPSRSKLYDMYHRCLVRRAFGSAPALSSAAINSK